MRRWFKGIRVAACLLAAPLFAGCVGTETGNPSIGKVSLALTDPTTQSTTLTIREAWLSLDSVTFVSCDAEDTLISQEQFVADLAGGQHVGNTPSGSFCSVVLSVSPQSINGSQYASASNAPLSVAVIAEDASAQEVVGSVSEAAVIDLPLSTPWILDGTEDVVVTLDAHVFLATTARDGISGVDEPPAQQPPIMEPTPSTAAGGAPSGGAPSGEPGGEPVPATGGGVNVQGDDPDNGFMVDGEPPGTPTWASAFGIVEDETEVSISR